MASRPILWIDTETTALPPGDYRPWEIAMTRQESDGTRRSITILVADVDLTHADPESLAIGRFEERFNRELEDGEVRVSEAGAAALVVEWAASATVYAAQFQFDVGCLEPMLLRHDQHPSWHRRMREMESVIVGALGHDPGSFQACAKALGVNVAPGAAHTAAGDVAAMVEAFDMIMDLPHLRHD